MPENLIDASRKYYDPKDDIPTAEEVSLGCLQRIALACEVMARDRIELEGQLKWAEKTRDRHYKNWREAERSLSATRGVVTKLRKQLADVDNTKGD